jgi:hypothetical protein
MFFILFCLLFIINANSLFIILTFVDKKNQLSIKKILTLWILLLLYVASIIDGFLLTILYEYLFNPQSQIEGFISTIVQKNGYFYTTFICFHVVCSMFGFVYVYLWKKSHKINIQNNQIQS